MEKVVTNIPNTDNFISLFLQRELSQQVDWVRIGKYFRRYINPPKIDKDVNLKYFSDGLIEIIKEKLTIALDAQNNLKELRKKRIKLLLNFIPEKHHWFYLKLEVQLFSEYYVISKWINYWLNLWYAVNDIKPKMKKFNKYSALDIQKAKEFPIGNLYEGILRKSSSRLNGLCPFHQEKHGSFFIFPNNTWYCFGACSQGGDAINFVMKLRNINFIEAVKYLTYGHN